MTWYSEVFYHIPALKNYYSRWENSLKLSIEDSWKILIEMDDCRWNGDYDTPDTCCENIEGEFKCGYDDYCSVTLTLEELIKLRDGCNKAIDYYVKEKELEKLHNKTPWWRFW